MGVSVYWDDQNQALIYLSIVGSWTWDEFNDGITNLYVNMRLKPHPVHILVDIRYTAPQTNGPAWKSLSRALRTLPDNTGLILMCGVGYFTTAFFIQLAGMFPKVSSRLKQVSELPAAYAMIARWDDEHKQTTSHAKAILAHH